MINRVVLVGRLTKNPELRYTPNGIAVTSLRLAVNRPFTNQSGEREADFINVVVWRKQAENTAQYTQKGSLVGVDGRIQTRSYEAQDGRTVYVTEVVADSIQFLQTKNSSSGKSNGNDFQSNQHNYEDNQPPIDDPFANNGEPIDISDDDLPF